jgi:SOS-response transcriptional repressor LexA
MMKDTFSDIVIKYSDYELFCAAKELATAELLGYGFAKDKLKAVYEECLRRNEQIFIDAQTESYMQVSELNESQNIDQAQISKRFEYMTEQELEQFFASSDVTPETPDEAKGFIERALNSLCATEEDSYQIFHVSGTSMIEAHIPDGSKLLIDKRGQPKSGEIAVVSVNDYLFVKRIVYKNRDTWLVSENQELKPVRINKEMEFKVLGTVVFVYFTPDRKAE